MYVNIDDKNLIIYVVFVLFFSESQINASIGLGPANLCTRTAKWCTLLFVCICDKGCTMLFVCRSDEGCTMLVVCRCSWLHGRRN